AAGGAAGAAGEAAAGGAAAGGCAGADGGALQASEAAAAAVPPVRMVRNLRRESRWLPVDQRVTLMTSPCIARAGRASGRPALRLPNADARRLLLARAPVKPSDRRRLVGSFDRQAAADHNGRGRGTAYQGR